MVFPVTSSLANILLIDNETQTHRFLAVALLAVGYTPICTKSGAEALRAVATAPPDAILLDLALPDMDGQEVLVKLREFTDVPIIIVSESNREADKIRALDAGADDYVKKPFKLGELLARIRTSLRHRRILSRASERINLGTLTVDSSVPHVAVNGGTIRLTKHEHALLLLLTRNLGCVMTHSQLLTAIWGETHSKDVAYLRVYIGRLRAKLGAEFATLLTTENGVGYRLQDPSTRET